MAQFILSHDDEITIRIALYSWIAHCKHERVTMNKWADENPEMRDKCLANAKASSELQADAEKTLLKFTGRG